MLLINQLLAFRPNKKDLIFATKTFLAGMLALYIAFALNLAYPIWAVGTVFVIANPYAGMTSSKSIYRLLGTLLGAVVAVIVTPLFINTPMIFTLFLAVWVGWCLYFSLLDRTPRSYIFMLAGYTTVIICFNAIYAINTTSIFDMAIGRFLEISLGVVCSAVVTLTIFPVHIGPAIETRVIKTFKDTQTIFDKILLEQQRQQDYSHLLGGLARDISDIHVMAVYLSYEKSTLQGMTKPLQEMLNQMVMLVSNLVAISECVKKLDLISPLYRQELAKIHSKILVFLESTEIIEQDQMLKIAKKFDEDFDVLFRKAQEEQQYLLLSLKMDLRHFVQNIREIKFLWQGIQQGNVKLPESISSFDQQDPKLHRDHGIAIRGGISAALVVLIATGFWIISGWSAGFMLAEMAAICACILTFLDDPVPALKVFIQASIYASVMVFIYAYGIFPYVTSFWQLMLVLAPFIIYCLTLFPYPPLIGFSLPLLMGTVMGLNLQNRYHLDQITFFDASIATVMGPIIAVFIIHLVRSMSPEMTVKRILSLHYHAIRQAIHLSYSVEFRRHLRSMLDRIGILNTKLIQSEELKTQINLALIETSAVIDLARIQELIQQLPEQNHMVSQLKRLQEKLDELFKNKERRLLNLEIEGEILNLLNALNFELNEYKDDDVSVRIILSLHNIQSSLCHLSSVVRPIRQLGT